MSRRRLLLEEAHKEDPSKPSFEHATFCVADDESSGAAALSSTFQAFVGAELGRETAIEKEKREPVEARDVRGKAKSKSGANKGDP